jgi:hypothetical protein
MGTRKVQLLTQKIGQALPRFHRTLDFLVINPQTNGVSGARARHHRISYKKPGVLVLPQALLNDQATRAVADVSLLSSDTLTES